MKYTVEKVSACRVKFAVEAAAEEVAPIYKNTRAAYVAQAKVPGFRPGKAPMAQITKLYGKDIEERIRQSVFTKMLDAHTEAKLKLASVVDVEGAEFSEATGAKATFVLDVHPEFTTPDVTKLQVAKFQLDVTDAEMEEQLADIRRMTSTFREAVEGDVATEDDLISIAFTSDLNKDELSDAAKHYASDEEYWVQIREDAFIPGLKEVLTGKALGETVEHSATYPEDFRVTDLAGKTVKYSITIKTMRKLDAADDESVLKRFGMESMDQLRDAVKQHVAATKERAESERATKEVCEKMDALVDFELPEKRLLMATYDELNRDKTKPLETFKDDIEGLKKSDVYAHAQEAATRDLRRLYVLTQLAQERGVKLEAEEFNEALDRIGMHMGLKRNEVINRLNNNERMSDFLERELSTKMLDILVKESAVL